MAKKKGNKITQAELFEHAPVFPAFRARGRTLSLSEDHELNQPLEQPKVDSHIDSDEELMAAIPMLRTRDYAGQQRATEAAREAQAEWDHAHPR